MFDLTESALAGMWLTFAAALAACSPSPREAMNSSDPSPAITDRDPVQSASGAVDPAAMAPVPEPVSAAANPLPARPDTPAEAIGRRIMSTAYVKVGPDGLLTVKLRDGRTQVLRNVAMRARDYCGVRMAGDPAGETYCGGYAEVAAARPGGAPGPAEPDLARENPIEGQPRPPRAK